MMQLELALALTVLSVAHQAVTQVFRYDTTLKFKTVASQGLALIGQLALAQCKPSPKSLSEVLSDGPDLFQQGLFAYL